MLLLICVLLILFGAGVMGLYFGLIKATGGSIGDDVVGAIFIIAVGLGLITYGIKKYLIILMKKVKKIELRKKLSSAVVFLIRDTLLLIFRVSMV